MLYENSDPFILHEPGGHLDVTDAQYIALDHRRVRVEGSKWVPGPYSVKLEGARATGFQTVLVALLRNPHYVENASAWANDIAEKCSAKVQQRMGLSAGQFRIELRLIGHSASFGSLETKTGNPVEIGVLGIVTAQSADQADEIGKLLNPYLLHHPLTKEEEQPTFAFPFSPAEIPRGETFGFVLHHVMPLNDPMEAFTIEVHDLGKT